MIEQHRLSTAGRTLDAPEGAGPPSETGSDGEGNGEANGRASNGRFALGNKASRGNAFARRMAEHRRAMLDAIGADGVTQVAKKLLAQALAGDVAAARVVLSYCVGRPVEVVDPDRLDLDELALIREMPRPVDLVQQFCGRVEAGLAVQKAAGTQATTREDLDARIAEATRAMQEELRQLKARMDRLRGFDIDGDEDDDVLLGDADLGPENDPPPRGAA
jgi:hypothetical protein